MKGLAKTAVKVTLMRNPYVWITTGVLALLCSMAVFTAVVFITGILGEEENTGAPEIYQLAPGGIAQVSPEVLRWEPLVRKYAQQQGLESYVGILLALIQQESSGTQLDVMQSSESIGLPAGSITDPEYSINVGLDHFDAVLKESGGELKLALQSYNFGRGFIAYAKSKGGYSNEAAAAFSQMQAAKLGWPSYGDVDYVDHVLRYYRGGTDSVAVQGNFPPIGKGEQSFHVGQVHDVMKQYLGRPYVWGGRSPAAGGFDCSGLLEYAFGKIGKDLSGTAEDQFRKTVPVPESQIQPGDLVFFSTYKPGPSHVGMYVGNGQFINSNDGGLEYSSVDTWKKAYPFLGVRRVK
jgi:cell wall-associated NlpC family hydrolase